MSNYRIHSGDTLSKLAAKFHTSVSALMRDNPSIHNASMIRAGAELKIPGSSDSFVSHKPAPKSNGTTKTTKTPPAHASGGASKAFSIGMSHLGENASSLKLNNTPVGKDMDNWVSSKECCANFVSACLQSAGEIKRSQHSDSALGLMHNLDKDPHFKRVTLANAKPGDVVTFKVGATGHHSVMFAGWKNGKPEFLGSNNDNRDGTQRIDIGHMNYQILGIQHYVG